MALWEYDKSLVGPGLEEWNSDEIINSHNFFNLAKQFINIYKDYIDHKQWDKIFKTENYVKAPIGTITIFMNLLMSQGYKAEDFVMDNHLPFGVFYNNFGIVKCELPEEVKKADRGGSEVVPDTCPNLEYLAFPSTFDFDSIMDKSPMSGSPYVQYPFHCPKLKEIHISILDNTSSMLYLCEHWLYTNPQLTITYGILKANGRDNIFDKSKFKDRIKLK